jgi:hypothetical protein
MKYLSIISFILVFSACRYNSRTGSGNIISQTRSLTAFSGVHASGDVHVELQNGSSQSIVVEADDNIISYVETIVSGNILKVRLKDINNLRNATINVIIIAPVIKEIHASASAEISGKNTIISDDKEKIVASSGSKINLQVDVPSVSASASSGANINVSGKTRDTDAEASSGAEVNASGLLAETATASASSGASVKIFGSISINASASSGGNVKYSGGASNIKKNESSGGSVAQGNY